MGARIAAPPRAPRILWRRGGVLASELVPGSPRALARLADADAQHLGRLLRAVHGRRASRSASLPGWTSRAHDLAGYARRRGRDAVRRARTADERHLVKAAAGLVVAACPPDAGFAFLHGDLAGANVVWGPWGPVLVDWEFWRMGDPAEDLAYLEAVNDLPGRVARGVRAGYRASRALGTRIDAWHALVLVDAALWHRSHGDPADAARLLGRARVSLPA